MGRDSGEDAGMRPPAHILLEKHLNELGLKWEREFKFCSDRKWRADYLLCWPADEGQRIATDALIEIEGSVYTQGRHTRGAGYEKDLEKYNYASALGYKVFRFSTGQVLRGEAREFLKQWLYRSGHRPTDVDALTRSWLANQAK